MKKFIITIIIAGMLGWSFYEFYKPSEKEETHGENNRKEENIGLSEGQTPPDFELETLDGEILKLSDYKGERVILNFWATWCPPCRAEMPDFQRLYEEEDVEVLAVNLTSTEKSTETVKDFVNELGMAFPILLDKNFQVESDYHLQVYPTSYMIDSSGKIQFVAQGAINYDVMKRALSKMN